MSLMVESRREWRDLLAAFEFLTRLRVPQSPYEPGALARSVKYFPLVGLLIGAGSALVHHLLVPHLPLPAVALVIVAGQVAVTGCLHEDGLADAADGLGGGREPEGVLAIMRDSRIGTYGAAALALALLARVILIASLGGVRAEAYLIAAPVLSRWTTLPLGFWLRPARETGGQGARIARLATRGSLVAGTALTLVIVAAALRLLALEPLGAAAAVTLATGLYYRRRIGGITGDCFGATNQLAEVAVYLCGAWT